MFINRPLNIWAHLVWRIKRCITNSAVSQNVGSARYEKTGTPFPKELREYVEQMKSKSKVEPEEVVVPSTGAPPPKPGADSETCRHQVS